MNIGFIGNFKPYYSTENDRKWTLLNMGHGVVTFQEDITKPEELVEWIPKLDLLLYSHTHDPNYAIPDLIDIFKLYKSKGVPTVSIHLDKWAGLEREKDVGKEATWFTEYLFMADCSPEAEKLYKKHKLNYYYLPAGVIGRDCYMAPPDPIRFPHEIVFIGSKGYHKEYPFRGELVEFLHTEYKDKFGHYGNDGLGVVRGHDLNVLCSTAAIVVGDSCFGGQDNYVSDRYYETRGRGGLLLHPKVDGVDHVGVIHYKKEDTFSLKVVINATLKDKENAQLMRYQGFNQVRTHETYTERMQTMLDVVYEKMGFYSN